MIYEQTLTKNTAYRQVLNKKVPANVAGFIERWVNLGEAGKNIAIVETSSTFNIISSQPKYQRVNASAPHNHYSPALDAIINFKRLNEVRDINKFLHVVNEKLHTGGVSVGCVETSIQRKQRLEAKYMWPFNKVYCFFDYLAKQIWPKMPFLNRLYFLLTEGRNQVLSDIETFGRLYSSGFKLLDTLEAEGKLYFVVQKTGQPQDNSNATYGPLIRLNRTGRNGKKINVYKLRTMYPYSEYLQAYIYEQQGLQPGGKLKDDPRVNATGRFLRKYWIDELPMLINFFKGELKIFGVRPLSAHYFSLYPKEVQEYRKKFKPGLIPPLYADLPKTLEEIVDSEVNYLKAYENKPFITDLRYTFKAFFNIFLKCARSK